MNSSCLGPPGIPVPGYWFPFQASEVFSYNFIKHILDSSLSFLLLCLAPHDMNVGMLDLIPQIFIFKFSFHCSDWMHFISLDSRLLMCSSPSPSLQFNSSKVFSFQLLLSSVFTGSFSYFLIPC